MADAQYQFRVAALWAVLLGLFLVPLFGLLAWQMELLCDSGVVVFGITAAASIALLLLAVVCAIFGRT